MKDGLSVGVVSARGSRKRSRKRLSMVWLVLPGPADVLSLGDQGFGARIMAKGGMGAPWGAERI